MRRVTLTSPAIQLPPLARGHGQTEESVVSRLRVVRVSGERGENPGIRGETTASPPYWEHGRGGGGGLRGEGGVRGDGGLWREEGRRLTTGITEDSFSGEILHFGCGLKWMIKFSSFNHV